MPRPLLLLEPASEGGGVGVLAEADRDAWERVLALARLGAMVQERWSLMTKLHRNLQEPKRLQVKEEHDGCCCATCHARCFSSSLLPQLVGGRGAVKAAPRATSSHGDNLTVSPKESSDFWGKIVWKSCREGKQLSTCGMVGHSNVSRILCRTRLCPQLQQLLSKASLHDLPWNSCGWLGPGARECP